MVRCFFFVLISLFYYTPPQNCCTIVVSGKEIQKASPESISTHGACHQNRENILLIVIVMHIGVTLNNREGEGEYPEV